MSYDMEIEYEYDSVDDYTDVVFEYQTPRRSNKKLKDLSMSDATANVVKEVPRKGHLSIESSFSVPPGGSGKNSYVVEMEKAEAKKREELHNCQNQLINSYKASLSTYKLDMQQLQHEYEKRLTDMETNMKRAHQLEVEKILAEELSKQLREKSSFESKYNEMEKYHAQTVHELEFHHNERVHDLQQTVEVAKKSYEEKKSLMEKQFSEVQSRVEKQNKDIEARSQSHRAALANREALHKGEVLRRDEHIDRLSAQLRSSNAVVQEMMECMKTAQEVAALIILIHKNARVRGTEDYSSSELYSYMAADCGTGGTDASRRRDKFGSEVIVSGAQLEAAYTASKKIMKLRKKKGNSKENIE